MLAKISLSEMLAEMDSNCELFDRGDADHQNFYRFISYIIPIEKELNADNIDLKLPSLHIIVVAIANLKLEENKSLLGIKIKTSWFESLPEYITEKVKEKIEALQTSATVTPPTETKSAPINIRTSPKRPLSDEYKAQKKSPPEKPTKKNSFLQDKFSFVKNMGKRGDKRTALSNEAENKNNVK